MSLRNWSCCCYCFSRSSSAILLLSTRPRTKMTLMTSLHTGRGKLAREEFIGACSQRLWLFFLLELTVIRFVLRAYKRFTASLFIFQIFVELVPCTALLLLFSFFYVNHNVFFAHSLSVLSQTFHTKTHPPTLFYFLLHSLKADLKPFFLCVYQ